MAIGSKKVKRTARDRRKFRIKKALVGRTQRLRLSVFRSNKFTYAQIICDAESKTLLTVSSRDAEVISEAKNVAAELSKESEAKKTASTKSVAAAFALGKILAKKAAEKQLSEVVFDRNGFLYHGRVKAVADGAREGGLKF